MLLVEAQCSTTSSASSSSSLLLQGPLALFSRAPCPWVAREQMLQRRSCREGGHGSVGGGQGRPPTRGRALPRRQTAARSSESGQMARSHMVRRRVCL